MSGQTESREERVARDDDAGTIRRGQSTLTEGGAERRQAEADNDQGLTLTEADTAPDDSAPEGVFGPSKQ